MPSVTAPAITGELSCKSPPSARPRQRGRSAPPAPAGSRVSAMHRTRKPRLTPTIHSQALRVCDRTICGGPRPHQEPRNLQVSLPIKSRLRVVETMAVIPPGPGRNRRTGLALVRLCGRGADGTGCRPACGQLNGRCTHRPRVPRIRPARRRQWPIHPLSDNGFPAFSGNRNRPRLGSLHRHPRNPPGQSTGANSRGDHGHNSTAHRGVWSLIPTGSCPGDPPVP